VKHDDGSVLVRGFAGLAILGVGDAGKNLAFQEFR